MKYFKKIIFIYPIFFMSWHSMEGQTILPPSRMEVFMKTAETNSVINFGTSTFLSNTQLNGEMLLVLQDTLNISKIHVKLGTSLGTGDLLTKTFMFDDAGAFADGTSYSRKRFKVILGMGSYTALNNYFAEVRLEDSLENLSEVVQYINN